MKKDPSFLIKLANLIILISILLVIINIFFIFLTNLMISIAEGTMLSLYLLLVALEFIRTILLSLSIILAFRLDGIRNTSKSLVLMSIALGIFLNIFFLTRLFVYSCFAPSFSFSTMLAVIISFILIKIESGRKDSVPKGSVPP